MFLLFFAILFFLMFNVKENMENSKEYYCQRYGYCYKCSDGERKCGHHQMFYNKAKVFDTLDECENNLNPFRHLSQKECLKTVNAGWCTDYLSNGLCVYGTPEGPYELFRYNMCFPNQNNTANSWVYGDKTLDLSINKNFLV